MIDIKTLMDEVRKLRVVPDDGIARDQLIGQMMGEGMTRQQAEEDIELIRLLEELGGGEG